MKKINNNTDQLYQTENILYFLKQNPSTLPPDVQQALLESCLKRINKVITRLEKQHSA